MKKLGIVFWMFFGLGLLTVSAQEYDDMYFNSSDRKKAKKAKQEEAEKPQVSTPYSYYQPDNYSTYDVDPARIAEYEYQAEEARLQYQSQYNSTNPLYSQGESLDFQYYNPEAPYATEAFQEDGTTIINNYYGPNWNQGWNNGWNGYYGYNGIWSPYGWGNSWTIGFAWGNGWYDPYWGWYDPWFYRPGYAWGWGWNRPYYGWGWGAPYCWYDNGGMYYSPNTPSKARGVTRGSRVDRGGTLVANGRDNQSRGSNTVQSRGQAYTNGGRVNSSTRTDGNTRYTTGNRTNYTTATRTSYNRPAGNVQTDRSGANRGNRVIYINPRTQSDNGGNRTLNYNQRANQSFRGGVPNGQGQNFRNNNGTTNRGGTIQMNNRNNGSSNGNVNRSSSSSNRSSGVRSSGSSSSSRSSGARSSGGSSGGRSSGGSGSSRGGGRGN